MIGVAAGAIAAGLVGAAGGAVDASPVAALGPTGRGGGGDHDRPLRVASRLDVPGPIRRWELGSAGLSAEGRSIERWYSPAVTRERRRILVVAAIHGNEPVTRPIAEAISASTLPSDVSLTILPTINPDGWAAGTRRNAQGVDLNRNFPWRWSSDDGGPFAGSAPEVQAVMAAVRAGDFDFAAWIHQPLDYIAPIGGCPTSYASAWQSAVGCRRRDDVDQHGGGETWCARVAGVPTLLVEVNSWSATPELVDAHRRGFAACIDVVHPRR
jgi:protein MpaA